METQPPTSLCLLFVRLAEGAEAPSGGMHWRRSVLRAVEEAGLPDLLYAVLAYLDAHRVALV